MIDGKKANNNQKYAFMNKNKLFNNYIKTEYNFINFNSDKIKNKLNNIINIEEKENFENYDLKFVNNKPVKIDENENNKKLKSEFSKIENKNNFKNNNLKNKRLNDYITKNEIKKPKISLTNKNNYILINNNEEIFKNLLLDDKKLLKGLNENKLKF